MDRLLSLKIKQHAKAEAEREEEYKIAKFKTGLFRARQNPHINHDTAEKIEQFLALEEKDEKRALLFNFLAEKRHQDINLPSSMFDAPIEQRKRIANIINEQNRKMQANDNENQKFDRLKREVEQLVEQGYTFKQQPKKRVTFRATTTSMPAEKDS